MDEELKTLIKKYGTVIKRLVVEHYRLLGVVVYEPACEELIELTMPDPETIAMN